MAFLLPILRAAGSQAAQTSQPWLSWTPIPDPRLLPQITQSFLHAAGALQQRCIDFQGSQSTGLGCSDAGAELRQTSFYWLKKGRNAVRRVPSLPPCTVPFCPAAQRRVSGALSLIDTQLTGKQCTDPQSLPCSPTPAQPHHAGNYQPQNNYLPPPRVCADLDPRSQTPCAKQTGNNRFKLEVIYFISWDYKFNLQTRGQNFSLTRGP